MRFLALFTLLLFPTFLQAQDVTGTWRTHKTERGTLIVNMIANLIVNRSGKMQR